MLKSIYTPLSGAIAQERALEIIANNLANANTNAYKAEKVTFRKLVAEPFKNYATPLPPANYKVDLEDVMPLKGNEIAYVGVDQVYKDMTKGGEQITGNPLDVMLDSEGFLVVNTPQGERLTRDGALTINSNGILTSKNGDPILGERGNIVVNGQNFEITVNGEIYENDRFVDKLLVKNVSDAAQLEKVGGNLYFYGGPEEEMNTLKFPQVIQGSLERSNVNVVESLANMILAHRSYEAYSKALKNYDSMMEKSSNTIGEVRG